MDSKLHELTRRIYEEGIEKANAQAKEIIDNADKTAFEILDRANKAADEIIVKAKDDSEKLRNKISSEIKLAGSQAVSSLKQEIVDLLSYSSLEASIKIPVSDKELIKSVINHIISKWDFKNENMSLELYLPEKMKNELAEHFKAKAHEMLTKGIEIKYEKRMEGGFKIIPKDESFIMSFTDKDFNNFFQSFLKPVTKEILFPGEK